MVDPKWVQVGFALWCHRQGSATNADHDTYDDDDDDDDCDGDDKDDDDNNNLCP